MNILSFLKPKAQPQPEPRQEVTTRHTYQLKDGKLGIEAATLDAYYKADADSYRAKEMLEFARAAERLKSEDGKKGDFDPRPQHVVLPNLAFEFHGDTGKFEHTSAGRVITGDAVKVTVQGGYNKDVAVWDREKSTFTYQYTQSERAADPAPQRTLIADEVFRADGDGKVALPGASSLAEAAQVAPKREMAERAEDLIQAAGMWHQAGMKLDGKRADINPAKGATVAPQVLIDSLPDENVMSLETVSGGEDGLDEVAARIFGLQVSGNDFLVVGEGSSQLSGTSDENATTLTFDSYGLQEELLWSKADGTVSYKKYDLTRQRRGRL